MFAIWSSFVSGTTDDKDGVVTKSTSEDSTDKNNGNALSDDPNGNEDSFLAAFNKLVDMSLGSIQNRESGAATGDTHEQNNSISMPESESNKKASASPWKADGNADEHKNENNSVSLHNSSNSSRFDGNSGSMTPRSVSSVESNDSNHNHADSGRLSHSLVSLTTPCSFSPYQADHLDYVTESTWTHDGRDLLEDYEVNCADITGVGRAEAKQLKRRARKDSRALIGWMVALYDNNGLSMGVAVVTGMRKEVFTRRSNYRLSSPDHPDCWVRLKKSARKRGINYWPLRRIYMNHDDSKSLAAAANLHSAPTTDDEGGDGGTHRERNGGSSGSGSSGRHSEGSFVSSIKRFSPRHSTGVNSGASSSSSKNNNNNNNNSHSSISASSSSTKKKIQHSSSSSSSSSSKSSTTHSVRMSTVSTAATATTAASGHPDAKSHRLSAPAVLHGKV